MSIILFVDDDPDSLYTYQKAMSLIGHTALLAANGEQALLTAEKTHLDLIVLDFHLPDMNGMTLIKKIKENKSLNVIPIIMLSASSTNLVADDVISAGAEIFMNKPLSLEDFLSVVNGFL